MSAIGSLGIDLNSIILYVVNFGIIFFFVSKYLSGPIISMLEKRAKKIKDNLEEIDKLKVEISKNQKELEESKRKALDEMNANILRMNNELEEKTKKAMAEVEVEKEKMLKAAEAKIETRKEKLMEEVKEDILKRVQNMVNYIVSNKVPKDIVEESVAEAWAKYSTKK